MDRVLSTQSIIISKCSNFSCDMLLMARSKITWFFPLIPTSLKWTRENAKNLKCGSHPSFCSLTRDYCNLDFFFFLTILSPKFLLPCYVMMKLTVDTSDAAQVILLWEGVNLLFKNKNFKKSNRKATYPRALRTVTSH